MVNDAIFPVYKNKRVFVTGHTGFKGSWLIAALHQAGAVVKGYSLTPETNPSLFELIKDSVEIDSQIADINDAARVEKEILAFKPDFVFHLAAQPLVRKSYQDPLGTFATNVIGTANVLNALTKLENPCAVVLITTDKVYENKEWHYPYRETDRLGGYDPYSASKAASEIVISSFERSFFNPTTYKKHGKAIVSVRAGNVMGGGDWSADRLLPDIARSLSAGQDIIIRNPTSIRPWQHVLEPVFGYLQLGAALAADPAGFSGAWNFGPASSDHLTVVEIAELAVNEWGQGKLLLKPDPDSPHEAGFLKLDISKVINTLHWKPKMNTSDAVRRTILWYKSFYHSASSASELMKADFAYYKSLS